MNEHEPSYRALRKIKDEASMKPVTRVNDSERWDQDLVVFAPRLSSRLGVPQEFVAVY